MTVKKTPVSSWQHWNEYAKINYISLEIEAYIFIFHLPLWYYILCYSTLHLIEKVDQFECKYLFCHHPYRKLSRKLMANLQLKWMTVGELHWDTTIYNHLSKIKYPCKERKAFRSECFRISIPRQTCIFLVNDHIKEHWGRLETCWFWNDCDVETY